MGSGSMARNTAAKSANATPASSLPWHRAQQQYRQQCGDQGSPAFVKGDTTMAFP